MKPAILTFAVGLMLTMPPSDGEARDLRRANAQAGLSSQTTAWSAGARWAPPVVTIAAPDLGAPVAAFTYSRLDDGYDHPVGYGEYALYGRWAFDRQGRPLVARCRLVWLDGARWRSLNRCE